MPLFRGHSLPRPSLFHHPGRQRYDTDLRQQGSDLYFPGRSMSQFCRNLTGNPAPQLGLAKSIGIQHGQDVGEHLQRTFQRLVEQCLFVRDQLVLFERGIERSR